MTDGNAVGFTSMQIEALPKSLRVVQEPNKFAQDVVTYSDFFGKAALDRCRCQCSAAMVHTASSKLDLIQLDL